MSIPCPTKAYHTDTYPSINPTRAELSSKGKNIFITGGGAGIGKHVAKAFVLSGAATIALVGRTASTLISTKAELSNAHPLTIIYTYVANIKDFRSISSAMKNFTEDAAGKIDVLVSNAGYLPDWRPLADSDPSDWWEGYETNVRGSFNLAKAFPSVAAPDATALNITSAGGGMPYVPNASGYATSKLAANKLWEYLSHENPGMIGISFHPGAIAGTDMYEKAVRNGAILPSDTPELAAHFTVWLASPEAKFLNTKSVWSAWDVDELKANAKQIQESLMFTMGHKNYPDMIPFEH